MMGPNTTTGHLSVIYSTECQVNFSLRVLGPILKKASLFSLMEQPTSVAVTLTAERNDNQWIQDFSKNLVWASGCTSWYIDPKTGRNTMLYPDWQFKYWLRSIFVPIKQDFVYKRSPKDAVSFSVRADKRNRYGTQFLWNSAILASIVGIVSLSAGIARGSIKIDDLNELSKRTPLVIKGISKEAINFLSLQHLS